MGVGSSTPLPTPSTTPLATPRKKPRSKKKLEQAKTPQKQQSSEQKTPKSAVEKYHLTAGQIRGILARANQLLLNPKLADQVYLDEITKFNLKSVTGFKTQNPKSPYGELISVSIFHRHGARGPGDSELKPWTDKEHAVVKQWVSAEMDQLTSNGSMQMKSLGHWFAERYLMRADDTSNTRHAEGSVYAAYPETKLGGERLVNKRAVWRSSSSGRATKSGEHFTQALSRTYNHQLQLKPVKNMVPKEPDRHEQVEGENRADDHGMDHFFRPWNVFKSEMNELKRNIGANILWAEKASVHLKFLKKLFTSIGCDKCFLNDPTKMLWCTTYFTSLFECEKFWCTEEGFVERSGQRNALSVLLGEEDVRKELQHLSCWVWNQRFVYTPYLVHLGGRVTFDILQQLLCFEDSALSVFSGHDYTLISILSLLQVLQKRGGMIRPIEFGAYIIFELWSKSPPMHHSDTTNGCLSDNATAEGLVYNTAFCNGVDNKMQKSAIDKEERKRLDEERRKEMLRRSYTDDPGDQRVLRVLWSDSPFDPKDQHVCHETQKKYSRSRNPREQEKFLYSWPIREDKEINVMQIDMHDLRDLMDRLHASLENLGVEPYIHKGLCYEDFKREYLNLPLEREW